MYKMHLRLQRCAGGVRDVVEANEVGYTARAVADLAWTSGVVSSGEGGFLVSDSLIGVPTVYHLQTVHRRMQQVPPQSACAGAIPDRRFPECRGRPCAELRRWRRRVIAAAVQAARHHSRCSQER